MAKRALIIGITGQDGSYLAEFLLSKKYEVFGIARTNTNLSNIARIQKNLKLFFGDSTTTDFLYSVLKEVHPDEIYNLASVSTVAQPWHDPVSLFEVTGLVPLKILEYMRHTLPDAKLFQASSAEMFGEATESPQKETTIFKPRNPYGAAKIFAHTMVGLYRKNHNLFATSGILYNHESLRRPDTFVTKKIISTLVSIKAGSGDILELGNLDAMRDWGNAKEYVEAMWMMLQAEKPQDYIIATGTTHSVREFVELTAHILGMKITWQGKGIAEVGADETGKICVKVNPTLYRQEHYVSCGDSSKITRELGWKPHTSLHELINDMINLSAKN